MKRGTANAALIANRPSDLFEACQRVAGAIMAALCTTGYRRHAGFGEIEVRTVRFVLKNINRVANADSTSTRAVHAVSMCR